MADDFDCPGCGAEIQWSAGSGDMVCPYCGHNAGQPVVAEGGAIVEYSLEEARSQAPKGYGTQTQSHKCDACGAVYDLDPSVEASACPFCSSPQVAAAPDDDVIRPGSVLPFAVEKNDAIRMFRDWLGTLWFRPNDLKGSGQIQSIKGIYIPAWTFDAHAHSHWTAEAGFYYYEEEEYETDEGTKTREVRKTRWEPASGQHEFDYDDWLVQASGGLEQQELKWLLPFDLSKLRPYDTGFLQGFNAERYQVGLDDAWDVAQKELHGEETSKCRQLVPGDTERNLKVNTSFGNVTFKHTLLPIWIAAYRYQGEVYRYLVNGETGKASGTAPYSKVKIALFVLAILTAIGLCLFGGSIFAAIGAAVGAN